MTIPSLAHARLEATLLGHMDTGVEILNEDDGEAAECSHGPGLEPRSHEFMEGRRRSRSRRLRSACFCAAWLLAGCGGVEKKNAALDTANATDTDTDTDTDTGRSSDPGLRAEGRAGCSGAPC